MEFDFSKAYDGRRLTSMTRASVQSNGNLCFPREAARQLGISLESSLLICPMGPKDLAVTVVDKDNERGFKIKKTGPYFYVPFRSLMTECGIDCTKVRVVYDIIELNEQYEGHSVFKFNRRIIDHTADAAEEEGVEQAVEAADEGAGAAAGEGAL